MYQPFIDKKPISVSFTICKSKNTKMISLDSCSRTDVVKLRTYKACRNFSLNVTFNSVGKHGVIYRKPMLQGSK